MDEEQFCTLDDAPMIANEILDGCGVIFGYRTSVLTVLVIYINRPAIQIGRLPYSGQSHNRYCIGIGYKGFSHFDLSKQQYTSYIGEKLNLPIEEAYGVTDLLNAIGDRLREVNK